MDVLIIIWTVILVKCWIVQRDLSIIQSLVP